MIIIFLNIMKTCRSLVGDSTNSIYSTRPYLRLSAWHILPEITFSLLSKKKKKNF